MDSVNGFVLTVTEECSSVVRCEQGVLLVIFSSASKILTPEKRRERWDGGGELTAIEVKSVIEVTCMTCLYSKRK